MNQVAGMDRALDEMLVQLGGMVLRLSSPEVTRTPKSGARWRARSTNIRCARRARAIRACTSSRSNWKQTIKPHLRLVASR